MNKYKVRISRKDGGMFDVNEIKGAMKHPKSSRWVCSGLKGLAKDGVVASELDYVTAQEDVAIVVYAHAKRNLDLRIYMVSLEMPKEERKPQHLGSC